MIAAEEEFFLPRVIDCQKLQIVILYLKRTISSSALSNDTVLSLVFWMLLFQIISSK